MIKPFLFFIDMDNTLNNLSSNFFFYLQKMEIPYDRSLYNSYAIENCILTNSGKERKEIKKAIFSDPNFWLSMEYIDSYVYKTVSWINNHWETCIATTPFRPTEDYKVTKKAWLKEYFSFFEEDQIIFERDKEKIFDPFFTNIIIDDKPETLVACKKKGFITLCPNQVYNQGLREVDFYFSSWKEVPSIIHSFHF